MTKLATNLAVATQAMSPDELAVSRSLEARYDLGLALVILGLLGIGLIMVTSASISIAGRELDDPFYYARRQAAYLLVALVSAGVVLNIPLFVWRKFSPALLLMSVVLLAAVITPGLAVK